MIDNLRIGRIVFTRHQLTEGQLAGITDRRGELAFMTEEASKTLKSGKEAVGVIDAWVMVHERCGILEIYGVFPPILRGTLHKLDCCGDGDTIVRLYEAHSINRAPEGERPTFEFVSWEHTGTYSINSQDLCG